MAPQQLSSSGNIIISSSSGVHAVRDTQTALYSAAGSCSCRLACIYHAARCKSLQPWGQLQDHPPVTQPCPPTLAA